MDVLVNLYVFETVVVSKIYKMRIAPNKFECIIRRL